MAQERKTKRAQWLRGPYSFETVVVPPAYTPLIPLRQKSKVMEHIKSLFGPGNSDGP